MAPEKESVLERLVAAAVAAANSAAFLRLEKAAGRPEEMAEELAV
jgi:hypothetical protein